MTQAEREYYTKLRGLLLEQAKALAEQRGAIVNQAHAIEKLLGIVEKPHEPTDNETLTTRLSYSP